MSDSDVDDPIPQLEPHPFALLFPPMSPEEFSSLEENIQIHGLRTPIALFHGQILDGVNRYKACVNQKVPITTINFPGDEAEALSFVVSSNMHRRTLNESQKAMLCIDINRAHGRLRVRTPGATQEQLATSFNVSRRMVSHASKVISYGNADLINLVRTGQLPVHIAATAIEGNEELLNQLLLKPEEYKQIAKEISRDTRMTNQANKTIAESAKLGERIYNVIYADPPWKFEVYSEETGMEKSAENHYETMEMGALLDLQIPAADDCVMFMWVTVPHLDKGIGLLAQWGFEYKSAWFWDKQNPGTGYWFRNQVEIILVGTKGSIAAPVAGTQPPQLISEAKTTHSTKPDAFANYILGLYPNMPKLEMFARKPRKGWDVWGKETGYTFDVPNDSFVQERLDSVEEVIKPKRNRRK